MVLSSLFIHGNVQEYTPFYLDDVKWTMQRVIPAHGIRDRHLFWEIYTLNDTIIENKTYRKVATRNLCELTINAQGSTIYNYSINTDEFIFGGIREENKKVYFLRFEEQPSWQLFQYRMRSFPQDREHLLYDFDVSPGDTIHFSSIRSFEVLNGDTSFYTTDYFSIIRERLLPLNGHNNHSVINSNAYAFPHETGKLIEGIGSDYGFFGAYDSYLTVLNCFEMNGEVVYSRAGCDFCAGFVSTSEKDPFSEIKVYPNPTSHSLNIENNSNLKIIEIRILDTFGKELSINRYHNQPHHINLSNFNTGFLFLQIKFENGDTVVRKVAVH